MFDRKHVVLDVFPFQKQLDTVCTDGNNLSFFSPMELNYKYTGHAVRCSQLLASHYSDSINKLPYTFLL